MIMNVQHNSDVPMIGGVLPYTPVAGESYMNEHQLQHFRKLLSGWKQQLMEEVDVTIDHMKEDAATFADTNDRATQESEFALELRTRDRERKLIRKIEKALKLLEDGDFGYCKECGVEIGLARLEARPTADMCVDCKSIDEQRERHYAK
jgi:DnaK suppressor protein